MGNRQPKKYIRPINYSDIPFGKDARINYTKVILNHAPIIPKPLEYEDIDNCFIIQICTKHAADKQTLCTMTTPLTLFRANITASKYWKIRS